MSLIYINEYKLSFMFMESYLLRINFCKSGCLGNCAVYECWSSLESPSTLLLGLGKCSPKFMC
jgi:hypothetical protein